MFERAFQDFRFAIRLLRASPLFTITAALSLAIGIGANTTVFSIANTLLLRPLPGLASPDRLVDIGRTQRGEGFDTVSHHYYRAVRERATTLSGIYAVHLEPTPMSLGGRSEAERVYGTMVSGSYFPTLGTRPALGRLLNDQDDVTYGGHPVAVISHKLWERRFGSDPGVVGQTVLLNNHQFSIVGVAERGFQGTTLLEPDALDPAGDAERGVAADVGADADRAADRLAGHGWTAARWRDDPAGEGRADVDRHRAAARVSRCLQGPRALGDAGRRRPWPHQLRQRLRRAADGDRRHSCS